MAASRSRKMVRRIVIKIFAPDNVYAHRRIFLAGDGKYFSEQNIEQILEDVAAEIEKRMPEHEYELVELVDRANFNFICRGERNPYTPGAPLAAAGTPHA